MATIKKTPVKGKTKGTMVGEIVPNYRAREEWVAAGKALPDKIASGPDLMAPS